MTIFALFAACILLSQLLHRATRRVRGNPSLLMDGLPSVTCTLLFLAWAALLGAPLAACFLAMGGAALLFVLNRTKEHLFDESISIMDFVLLGQICRHPSFYLPYLTPLPVAAALLLSLLAMAGLAWAESPLLPGQRLEILFLALPCLAFFAYVLLPYLSGRRAGHLLEGHPLALDPLVDTRRYGLLGCWHLHLLHHRFRGPALLDQAMGRDADTAPPACVWDSGALAPVCPDRRPHMLLVQAESFFDLRRLDPELGQDMYPNFDRLAAMSQSGLLTVQAHGAYTMRTEYSVLTGVPMKALGVGGLNPYVAAAKRPFWSLARHLSKVGYRVLCVHPFSSRFFRRDLVMPHLGFDSLIDDSVFGPDDYVGPYVGDKALGRYLCELLSQAKEPLFLFAITMEGHGPWSRKRLSDLGDAPSPRLPDWAGHDLHVYARHLASTDAMFGQLSRGLAEASDRPGLLCTYGDHMGSIPEVFQRTGHTGGETDYLLWRSEGNPGPVSRNLTAEELGRELLRAAHMVS